jgi:hypothetical protein
LAEKNLAHPALREASNPSIGFVYMVHLSLWCECYSHADGWVWLPISNKSDVVISNVTADTPEMSSYKNI